MKVKTLYGDKDVVINKGTQQGDRIKLPKQVLRNCYKIVND